MTDSPKDELEKLHKLRTELESRLVAIEAEQKSLEEETKIIRQKVAIRELEKSLKRSQEELAGLHLEKKGLEDELEEPKKIATSEAIQKTKAEIEDKKDKPETEEQTRIIWKKSDQTPISWKKDEQTPESDETPQKQESKKKLGFF